jgi:hypothetical protein
MRLSPLDPRVAAMRAGTAFAHFFLGRYDEAASWAAMALQDNPDFQAGLRATAASNADVCCCARRVTLQVAQHGSRLRPD